MRITSNEHRQEEREDVQEFPKASEPFAVGRTPTGYQIENYGTEAEPGSQCQSESCVARHGLKRIQYQQTKRLTSAFSAAAPHDRIGRRRLQTLLRRRADPAGNSVHIAYCRGQSLATEPIV